MYLHELATLLPAIKTAATRLDCDPRLHWYPLAQSSQLRKRLLLRRYLLGVELVLFRDAAGKVRALKDSCPHRAVPLSNGRLVSGNLVCEYHGWTFNPQGQCVEIPSLDKGRRIPGRACVQAFPCEESDGAIWVSLTPDRENRPPILGFVAPAKHGPWVYVDRITTLDSNIEFSVEQTIDPAHTNQLHKSFLFGDRVTGFVDHKRSDEVSLVDESDIDAGYLRARARWVGQQGNSSICYTVTAPYRVVADISSGGSDHKLSIQSIHVPLAERKTHIYIRAYYNMWTNSLLNYLAKKFALVMSKPLMADHMRAARGSQSCYDRGDRSKMLVEADLLVAQFRRIAKAREKYGLWNKDGVGEFLASNRRAGAGLEDSLTRIERIGRQ